MVWNSSAVSTANLDAGTDNPAAARADLLDLTTKHNGNAAHMADSIAARAFLGIDTGLLFPSVGAGALTIALRTQQFALPISADDPIKIKFPATNGNFNVRTVAAPLSITVPSGATLGHQANNQSAVHVYAVDVAGVVHLAVSSRFFGVSGFAATTQITAGATSSSVMYSTAASSSYLYTWLGTFTYTHATPGTWANFPVNTFRNDNFPKVIFSRAKSATQLADNAAAPANTVVFQTSEIDTLSLYIAASNAYIALETGDYHISAAIGITGSAVGANNVTVEIRVNNVVVRAITRPVATNAVENLCIDARINVAAGLPITVRCFTSTANAVTINTAGTSFHGCFLGR